MRFGVQIGSPLWTTHSTRSGRGSKLDQTDRDPDLVRRDLENGFVSAGEAARTYGHRAEGAS